MNTTIEQILCMCKEVIDNNQLDNTIHINRIYLGRLICYVRDMERTERELKAENERLQTHRYR